ncbi:hypothetical protein ACGFYU_27650 [Streptomyces sp. NPDC048337]|uniref:hypothetical protein n=1 Tax=Streptomyces sp. NPDC048337 TaxID=3365535 RepID=UPI00371775CA
MNLLKLLFKAITSDREPDALPRSEVYRWRCDTCRDSYVGSDRQHVGNVAASHRRRSGGKCRTPKVVRASEM